MSEMQGVEQQSTRVLMRQLQLEMYPSNSAYRSETGGMLDALRKLTVEEIRNFHSDAYKPWNICLHVDGSIPIDELMRILNNTVDPMILANTKMDASVVPATWKRPFLETPSAAGPVIEKDVRKVVPFMDQDETVGEVVIAWKGTKTGDHLDEMVSIEVCRNHLDGLILTSTTARLSTSSPRILRILKSPLSTNGSSKPPAPHARRSDSTLRTEHHTTRLHVTSKVSRTWRRMRRRHSWSAWTWS